MAARTRRWENEPASFAEDLSVVVVARAQHPTLDFYRDPMFDSLRRWNRQEPPREELSLAATIHSMDEATAGKSCLSAAITR